MSDFYLLDAGVLIALSFPDHIHHERATRWFYEAEGQFATCPTTQRALVQFALRQGATAETAQELLEAIVSLPEHVFWPDDVACDLLPWRSISGYRQVTDAYLFALAQRHGGRLVTLDDSLSVIFAGSLLLPA